jgi:hypothetical protein
MPTLIEFYIQKTGKKRDEITILEYEALQVALEFMIEESKQELNKGE